MPPDTEIEYIPPPSPTSAPEVFFNIYNVCLNVAFSSYSGQAFIQITNISSMLKCIEPVENTSLVSKVGSYSAPGPHRLCHRPYRLSYTLN